MDNKKLPVGIAGEKKAIFYNKTFEEREAIDNKNLEKYVADIYRGEGDLNHAIKKTYEQANKLSQPKGSGRPSVDGAFAEKHPV